MPNFSVVHSTPAHVCNRTHTRWRSPQAAVLSNSHLPMRSYEVKNRTNVDDIKSLRLITAVKTPNLPDGRFDLEAYDDLVNMQIDGGADGVIVGGTTGEGQLMSWDEHIMLIGHTINCFGSHVKVIGNTGSNSTREAIHATEQGFAVGMHAALHINPYYGTISVISNLVPGLMRQLMFDGKNPSLNSKLMPLMEWLFAEPNPIGLNTALAQLGVARPIFRLPYVPRPLHKRHEFVELVNEIGRENFVGKKDVKVLDDDDFILY